jgi:hypothetical protein
LKQAEKDFFIVRQLVLPQAENYVFSISVLFFCLINENVLMFVMMNNDIPFIVYKKEIEVLFPLVSFCFSNFWAIVFTILKRKFLPGVEI